ncbi:cyclopropane fatty-acyl-phospholipid synthase-like methyltransferase [Elusimicrobium posterum]|uniref:SAM-dependent methyltransferase n=1 Tax=Elusimicrobium posterum TaxID=3116653 RepID=UPI003C757B03
MIFFENERKNKQFIQNNLMGPNALLILDELLEKIKLNKNMRILDLGCGTGLTSMYLAKKTGAQIFAADLWIAPTDNYKRFKQFGLHNQITPLHVDATKPLPFADDYFDAVISIDSFHYYGAAPNYIDKILVPVVKKGGIIAVGVVGRQDENDVEMYAKIKPYLNDETNFHSLDWWTKRWQKSENIEITAAFPMKCHKKAWRDWLSIKDSFISHDIEMMKADGGKFFDTLGLAAKVIKQENSEDPKPWQNILG